MHVYSLWIGERLPLFQQVAMRSYLHYGHQVTLFTYDQVDDVPEGVEIQNGQQVLPADRIVRYSSGSPSLFANLFRYKFLADNGGTWVDTDAVCLTAHLPDAEYVFSSESTKTDDPKQGHPNLAYVKVPAGSTIMQTCYEDAAEAVRNCPGWGVTGPKMLLKHLSDQRHAVLPSLTFCPIPYRDAEAIYRLPAYVPPAATCGVHLWNEMFRRKGRSHVRGPAGCFFAELCRLFGA